MKLIEKLNELDKNSYCKYDLVNLYLVTNNNKETLQKLSESIDNGISAEEAYKILSEDFMDEMSEDELDVVEYEDGVIMEDPDLVASGFNSAAIDLIQKNYDLVQSYDSFLNTLDAENVEDSEDYKEIIQSAIDTTNNNIGKLSAIQNDLQPGTEEIYTGMKDAEETLAETESPVDESLSESRELVLPSKILDEFIKLIETNNYSIDSIKDTMMGAKHFQVTKLDTEFVEMPTTNELRLEAASLISAIHAFETKYGKTENTHSKYPVTWNFGMDDNHHLTAGIDVYGGVADEEELTEEVVNEAKLLKCETCGGNIEPDENGKFGTCDHCGNKYKIDESLNECDDDYDEESFYNKEGEEILTEDEDSEEPSELDYIDDDVSDLENKFKLSYDIRDFEPWSGAVQPFQNIVDAGKLDEFYEWVEQQYASGLDEQTLNDLLWYKTNTIYRNIGMKNYIKLI